METDAAPMEAIMAILDVVRPRELLEQRQIRRGHNRDAHGFASCI